jgi:methionine-rich copper-binding protein CopC
MATCLRDATLVCALFAVFAAAAGAHTNLVSTSPRTGTVLAASPPAIEIRFEHPVNMTAITLVREGTVVRALDFAPHVAATEFVVANPELAAGRNEIRWKALSSDGHVIDGTLSFVIGTAAAQ